MTIENLHLASPTLARRKSRSHQVAVEMREQMAQKRGVEKNGAPKFIAKGTAEVFIDDALEEDGKRPSRLKRLSQLFRKRA